ncbi:MAG: response regulator [Bacteriovoracia bacterium]
MNKQKVILLVEDNEQDELLTLRALRKHNIKNQVIICRDGEEAMNWLFRKGIHSERDKELVPQVILLDIKLPKIDGLEVLRSIRSHSETCRLPVVILTTSSEEKDLIQSYDLGANSYVKKPVDFNNFSEAIKSLGTYWLDINQIEGSV